MLAPESTLAFDPEREWYCSESTEPAREGKAAENVGYAFWAGNSTFSAFSGS